jgi:hypothetical protein
MAAPATTTTTRSRFTILIGILMAAFAIINLFAVNLLLSQNSVDSSIQLKSKEAFLNEHPQQIDELLNEPLPPLRSKAVATLKESKRNKSTSTTTSRRLTPNQRISHIVSHTGSIPLHADLLYNTTRGSFWLPRPPQNLIRGYQVRRSTSNFARDEYSNPIYNNTQGFITKTHVRVSLSMGFNAGDFFAIFIAPIISGRAASFRESHQGNKNSICVVGSILSWGIRYMWGPGLLYENKKTLPKDGKGTTEVVFATRGPKSFEDYTSSAPKGSVFYKVYGDAGSLLSWFYQPHDVTKRYPLCVLPHHLDWDMKWKVTFLTRMDE